MRHVESRIAQMAERRACVLTGRASAAIYLALRVLRERDRHGEVIVPAITCPAVVQAVTYAGFTPVYADVDVPDCTIAIASLRSLVRPQTRAVIPIHVFGNAAPIAEVCAIAREAGIPVIEDAAQAVGGRIDGRPIGNFGTFSVFSFGPGKIIDAGALGALLTDDPDAAARAAELARELPPLDRDAAYELRSLSERDLTHALSNAMRVDPEGSVGTVFAQMLPHYRSLHVVGAPEDDTFARRLEAELNALDENLARRRDLAQRYEAGLAPFAPAIGTPTAWHASGTVWRYSLLIEDPDRAIAVTTALRARGINASNHYWSVAHLMNGERLPGATHASRRLLNLWVDAGTSLDDVDRTVEVIARALSVPHASERS